jgi:hypothetical protein
MKVRLLGCEGAYAPLHPKIQTLTRSGKICLADERRRHIFLWRYWELMTNIYKNRDGDQSSNSEFLIRLLE